MALMDWDTPPSIQQRQTRVFRAQAQQIVARKKRENDMKQAAMFRKEARGVVKRNEAQRQVLLSRRAEAGGFRKEAESLLERMIPKQQANDPQNTFLRDAAREVNQRYAEPAELVGGRLMEASGIADAPLAPYRAVRAGMRGDPIGVLREAGSALPVIGPGIQQATRLERNYNALRELPGDIEAAYQSARGRPEDTQARLEDISLQNRIAGGLAYDPLNIVPGVGLTHVDDIRNIGRLGRESLAARSVRAFPTRNSNEVGNGIRELTTGARSELGTDLLKWRPRGEGGHIITVNVPEQARNQGRASALMEQALRDIRAEGGRVATADVETPEGARLLRKFGATFEDQHGNPISLNEAIEQANRGAFARIDISQPRSAPGLFASEVGATRGIGPDDVTGIGKAQAARQAKLRNAALEKYRNEINEGWTVEAVEVPDTAAQGRLQKEYDRLKGIYPIGNPQHPETIRFKELKAQLEQGGATKTEYRLWNPDRSRVKRPLSRTEYDAIREVTESTPTTPIGPDEGLPEGPVPDFGPDAPDIESMLSQQGANRRRLGEEFRPEYEMMPNGMRGRRLMSDPENPSIDEAIEGYRTIIPEARSQLDEAISAGEDDIIVNGLRRRLGEYEGTLARLEEARAQGYSLKPAGTPYTPKQQARIDAALARTNAEIEARRASSGAGDIVPPPREPPTGVADLDGPLDRPRSLPAPSSLKTLSETAQSVRAGTENVAGMVGRTVSRVPGARGATSLINPGGATPSAGVVREIGEQGARDLQDHLIAYDALAEAQDSLASAIETGIRQQQRRVGLRVKDGILYNKSGALGPTGHVFENPSLFRDRLTPEQQEFMDEVLRVLDDQNQLEIRSGVEKGQVFSDEGVYFPRAVTSVRGEEKIKVIARRAVGAKQGFQQERFYQELLQGQAEGVEYAGDTAGLVGARIRAGQKALRDQQVAEVAKRYGTEPSFSTTGTEVPALGGMEFKPETANILNEALTKHAIEPGLETLNLPNRLMRTLMATGDASAAGIQILKSLFNRPVAFGKAMAAGADALILDGRMYGRYIQNNVDNIESYVRSGGAIDSNEFAFSDVFQSGGRLERTLGRVTNRFDHAFQNMQNVNSLENYKAMVGMNGEDPSLFSRFVRKLMGDFGGTNEEAAAAIANKLSGRVSTKALGVQGTQRQAEAFLAFAPRYLRAITGLYTDAVQGGMRGAEARRALATFWGGVTVSYVLAAKAMGQEPHLDPRSKKHGGDGADFLTLEIGGQRVGVGGLDQRMLRTLADVYEDPESLTELSFTDNPALKFARGSTSPAAGLGIDIALREDYLGEPLDSPEAIARRGVRNVTPFGVSSAINEGPESYPAQFFGARSYSAEPDPKYEVWSIPRYEGLSADEGREVSDFLERVKAMRGEQLEQYGEDAMEGVTFDMSIDQLLEKEGEPWEHFRGWAQAIQRGVPFTDEYVQYLVENEGALRDRYPFLYNRNEVKQALFEAAGAR